jgi:deoxyribonuclease V
MRPFQINIPELASALVELIRQVPRGQVATYGDLAQALGDVRAAVWVAKLLADPPSSLRKIAHRVVNVAGEPSKHAVQAMTRLADDGVPLSGLRVDLEAARFCGFVSARPLELLKQDQERLAECVRLEPLDEWPTTVAAVDVSYRRDGAAVGAYVFMNAGSPESVWSHTETVSSPFPYIPGFLSYRELPVHARLLREAAKSGHLAPVLLVDGNGILHPRRCGIATLLGVLAEHPTIGVSKSLLCGSVVWDGAFGAGTGRVIHQEEVIAAALPPSARGKKPLYVSPGNLCTLEDAVAVIDAWRRDVRLPEPIRRADALSRAVAKEGLEKN